MQGSASLRLVRDDRGRGGPCFSETSRFSFLPLLRVAYAHMVCVFIVVFSSKIAHQGFCSTHLCFPPIPLPPGSCVPLFPIRRWILKVHSLYSVGKDQGLVPIIGLPMGSYPCVSDPSFLSVDLLFCRLPPFLPLSFSLLSSPGFQWSLSSDCDARWVPVPSFHLGLSFFSGPVRFLLSWCVFGIMGEFIPNPGNQIVSSTHLQVVPQVSVPGLSPQVPVPGQIPPS